jgi:hypothetical protein
MAIASPLRKLACCRLSVAKLAKHLKLRFKKVFVSECSGSGNPFRLYGKNDSATRNGYRQSTTKISLLPAISRQIGEAELYEKDEGPIL